MLLSVEQRLQIEPEVLKLVGCLRKRLARTRLVFVLHVKQLADTLRGHNSTPGTAANFQVVPSSETEPLDCFALKAEDMTPEDFCGQHRVHQGATHTEASELVGG